MDVYLRFLLLKKYTRSAHGKDSVSKCSLKKFFRFNLFKLNLDRSLKRNRKKESTKKEIKFTSSVVMNGIICVKVINNISIFVLRYELNDYGLKTYTNFQRTLTADNANFNCEIHSWEGLLQYRRNLVEKIVNITMTNGAFIKANCNRGKMNSV